MAKFDDILPLIGRTKPLLDADIRKYDEELSKTVH
jgi:hypothetical protein